MEVGEILLNYLYFKRLILPFNFEVHLDLCMYVYSYTEIT